MKKLLVFYMAVLIAQAVAANNNLICMDWLPVNNRAIVTDSKPTYHRLPASGSLYATTSLPTFDNKSSNNRLPATGSSSAANSLPAIDSIPAQGKDVQSIDGIIGALYDVISGPAGQKRNWDRMRTLFLPEGRLVATGIRPDGTTGKRVMSVEDYINTSGPFLEKNGFFEREVGRKTDQFGCVAHVFSTYDSKKTLADEKPFMRGINSIQLYHDGKRWWVLSVFWQPETAQLPIPDKYLQ